MQRAIEKARESSALTEPSSGQAGLYLYCVGLSSEAGAPEALGEAIGIEGCEVLGVAWGDLCAAVHHCPAAPYQSEDAEVVASWVTAHHRVVETAWRRWGTVLPLTFNTIIKGEPGGEPGRDAGACLLAWLGAERQVLKAKLEALAGKAEYGIQVSWDPQVVTRRVAQSDAQVRALEEQIKAKPPGAAYMHRQRLEALLKEKTEAMATAECTALYGRIARLVGDVRVEKPKADPGQLQMLVNLSCLVSQAQLPRLKAEHDRLSGMEGFSTRLIGPLPPYSFC
jgi:hypothetical protein